MYSFRLRVINLNMEIIIRALIILIVITKRSSATETIFNSLVSKFGFYRSDK